MVTVRFGTSGWPGRLFALLLVVTFISRVTLPYLENFKNDILVNLLIGLGSVTLVFPFYQILLAFILTFLSFSFNSLKRSTSVLLLSLLGFFLKGGVSDVNHPAHFFVSILGIVTSALVALSLIFFAVLLALGKDLVIKILMGFLGLTFDFIKTALIGIKDVLLQFIMNLNLKKPKKPNIALQMKPFEDLKQSNSSRKLVLRLEAPQKTHLETPPNVPENPSNIIEFKTEKSKKNRSYKAPSINILLAEKGNGSVNNKELAELAKRIEESLNEFNVQGKVTEIHPGPVVTTFEFEPAPGIKVGKVATLQDDLAMSLKAHSIRIVAPIPKKGTIGIEVPNTTREVVRLRSIIESKQFQNAGDLALCLGKDTIGEPVVVDLGAMPHLLIAGATGTGKSVCINALLISLLYKNSPDDLGLILIDPKVLELSIYEGIPHLKAPVITEPKKAKVVLQWAVKEMERRYKFLQKFGVRNIDSFNSLKSFETPSLKKIVIIIDELADLMFSVGREIEELIIRLAQKARAAGIHLIMATQRPSVDVVTGLIKANFPARISFRVVTRVDSRTILDQMGAEKLLGKGDMLIMLPGGLGLKRVHGAFVSDQEVQDFVESLKSVGQPTYEPEILELLEAADKQESQITIEVEEDSDEELYKKALEIVVQKGQASTSMIQRALRIGYNRAARLVERMEQEGLLGASDGVRPREVFYQNIKKIYPEL